MPESAQEKTEAPTPRRREEARENGQIARSSDLNAAVILMGCLLFLNWWGSGLIGKLLLAMKRGLMFDAVHAVNPASMGLLTRTMMFDVIRMVLPLLIGVVICALTVGYLQTGWIITFKPLTPKTDRLNPINGLKRLFSARSFVHLLMGLSKMGVLVAVTWWTMKPRIETLAAASSLSFLSLVGMALDLCYTLGLRLAIVLLLLAIIDYVYQRLRTEKDLRMTKEEIREEMKRMDGDPRLKMRRRQVQMQIALQRIRSAVPKADVIITNPTEFAVALQYDSKSMAAPRVVAKGTDYMAMRIREIAIEHGIPIVERPPLARAIYRTVEVGKEIPAEFYKAVAEVLAYVYELAGRGYRRPKMGVGVG